LTWNCNTLYQMRLNINQGESNLIGLILYELGPIICNLKNRDIIEKCIRQNWLSSVGMKYNGISIIFQSNEYTEVSLDFRYYFPGKCPKKRIQISPSFHFNFHYPSTLSIVSNGYTVVKLATNLHMTDDSLMFLSSQLSVLWCDLYGTQAVKHFSTVQQDIYLSVHDAVIPTHTHTHTVPD
jgi:hypothetical protein